MLIRLESTHSLREPECRFLCSSFGLPSANNATHLTGQKNLREVERNKREKHTVPRRYVILRLHEAVQEIVPHLNEHDHKRFSKGLARVFIDNYAAIPSESIRRLLALREAGIIHILALGEDYKMEINESRTVLKTEDNSYSFDVLLMPADNVRLK